jgi:ribosome-binding factor A
LQVLARLLREEVRDPRVGFVTLTGIDMSPDLKHAHVFISTLDDRPEEVLQALQHAAPFLRRLLGRVAKLRFTPELKFSVDESMAGGFRVDRILEELSAPPEDEPERER